MSTINISTWLAEISGPEIESPLTFSPHSKDVNASSNKRRRINPPTPEPSIFGSRMSALRDESPSKRGLEAEEETPRPNRKRAQLPRAESDYSLPSRSSASQSSSRLSPQKHLGVLERSDRGFRVRELASFKDKTPGLVHFLSLMNRASRGRGILPTLWRDRLREAQGLHDGFAEVYMDEACFGDGRDGFGCVPKPTDVLRVLECAIECQENLHGEATWNSEVHREVLQLALRSSDKPQFSHLVNFMPCSTAPLIREYLATSTPPKKVDFCLYIDPLAETIGQPEHQQATSQSLSDVLRATRDRLPGGFINHTSYFPLRERPIALSIETKKTGDGWEDAALQIGVWQAAHWEFLFRLVHPSLEQSEISTRDRSYGSQNPQPDQASEQLPEFLPGIIIQGHDWYLVVATKDGEQTVLWTKLSIGSTSSVMGIYQLVFGLQILGHWARETYWPILKAAIYRMAAMPTMSN